eukprot:4400361-Prymnesium_polylepis.2
MLALELHPVQGAYPASLARCALFGFDACCCGTGPHHVGAHRGKHSCGRQLFQLRTAASALLAQSNVSLGRPHMSACLSMIECWSLAAPPCCAHCRHIAAHGYPMGRRMLAGGGLTRGHQRR